MDVRHAGLRASWGAGRCYQPPHVAVYQLYQVSGDVPPQPYECRCPERETLLQGGHCWVGVVWVTSSASRKGVDAWVPWRWEMWQRLTKCCDGGETWPVWRRACERVAWDCCAFPLVRPAVQTADAWRNQT